MRGAMVCSDACIWVNCSGRGQQCVDGRCVCRHRDCPTNYDPVCGTDSVTYPNQCTLDLIACTEQRQVDTLHRGVCQDEFMGSGFEGEYRSKSSKRLTATGTYVPCAITCTVARYATRGRGDIPSFTPAN